MAPDLPECARNIPAMTTEAERLAYYRLTMAMAPQGAVVEMGAWLGASTAYIAAGVRDSGACIKASVFDRFKWQPEHEAKGAPSRNLLRDFLVNLGPLLDYVEVYPGEITEMTWASDPVSMIVFDAPKRVPAISSAMKTMASAVRPGTVLAWQDFAYFPSYDIPACMIRLGAKVEFVEAVYPGTTAVFSVVEPWNVPDVSRETFDLHRWTPDEIESRWDEWEQRLPEPMRARFACGAAMFMHDIGDVKRARQRLRRIVEAHAGVVMPKWRYLKDRNMAARYVPLFDELRGMGAL